MFSIAWNNFWASLKALEEVKNIKIFTTKHTIIKSEFYRNICICIFYFHVTYAYEGVCVCVCEWVNKEMPNIMKNVIASWTDMFNIILRKYNDAKAVAFREPCSLEGKKGGYLIPTKNVLVQEETIEIGLCKEESP